MVRWLEDTSKGLLEAHQRHTVCLVGSVIECVGCVRCNRCGLAHVVAEIKGDGSS